MPLVLSRADYIDSDKESDLKRRILDEFGRVGSRSFPRQAIQQQFAVSTKARSRKDSKAPAKSRSPGADDDDGDVGPPDGSFLPLRLERPRYEHPDDPTQELPPAHDYGYLSYQRHVILGLEEVARLVDVVGDELGTRGLTTPFIFSTLALDASPSAVKRLIQTFLKTCARPSVEADRQGWRRARGNVRPPGRESGSGSHRRH